MRFKDRVVFLTGASSGMGRAAAIKFASEGAKVVAIARRKELLDSLELETKNLPGTIEGFVGDVTDEEKIDEIVAEVMEKYGRIDVLLNNAGIMDSYKSITSVTDELWDKVFEVNVNGPMRLMRKIIPIMLEQETKGNIVNTASVAGLFGGRGGIAYVASKHAVVAMTKNIALTHGELGIRCNAIAPGTVETNLGNSVVEPDMLVLDKFIEGMKLSPRMAEPEEIINVTAFLASDEASFINGAVITVDAGWTAF